MAQVFRSGLLKLAAQGAPTRLCKTPNISNVAQVAFITSKAKRGDKGYITPAPYPYWRKRFSMLERMLDPMTYRFDDNSKLVVVDGPPAVGKSKFAKALAEELEMLYMPAPTFDDYYINTAGDDIRDLDEKLPPNVRSCDIKKYMTHPHDLNVPTMQLIMFQMRLEQHVSALLHILSTGQGVVLNRSMYSDPVFARAMHASGYLTNEEFKHYKLSFANSLQFMFRPQLVIYLDVPVSEVKNKIKKRGVPYEVNSKVLSTEYLTSLENAYKTRYLKKVLQDGHLLVYDWTEEGDLGTVVEDIEALDFEYDTNPNLFHDWIFATVDDLRAIRGAFHNPQCIVQRSVVPDINAPDSLVMSSDDRILQYEIYYTLSSERYAEGYDPSTKKSFLFDMKYPKTRCIRRTVRDLMYYDIEAAEGRKPRKADATKS